MSNDWIKWLHERAYALWEADGRPDGHDQEHWHQAEQERSNAEAGSQADPADLAAIATPPITTGEIEPGEAVKRTEGP
ncbi:DUF2934 domain-containing protein [Pararhizobium sp.]|uniref:DUF2934 domain-containing protein n=1 Tax=Pararhizobium sp. TaxID=1977563 RepID=UPI002723A8AD|nr:DUF2934 domain-containing protein [Pararhizobium sp.]MDO9416334.1 DUF2934 domain-containing protein [Pararhizobium sp.]